MFNFVKNIGTVELLIIAGLFAFPIFLIYISYAGQNIFQFI